jgi:hypothetical protein
MLEQESGSVSLAFVAIPTKDPKVLQIIGSKSRHGFPVIDGRFQLSCRVSPGEFEEILGRDRLRDTWVGDVHSTRLTLRSISSEERLSERRDVLALDLPGIKGAIHRARDIRHERRRDEVLGQQVAFDLFDPGRTI